MRDLDHALLNARQWIGTPEVIVIPFFSLSWAWEWGQEGSRSEGNRGLGVRATRVWEWGQQGSGNEGNRGMGVRLPSSRCYIPHHMHFLSNRMNILETLCFQHCRETYPDCYRNAITITVQFRVHFKCSHLNFVQNSTTLQHNDQHSTHLNLEIHFAMLMYLLHSAGLLVVGEWEVVWD